MEETACFDDFADISRRLLKTRLGSNQISVPPALLEVRRRARRPASQEVLVSLWLGDEEPRRLSALWINGKTFLQLRFGCKEMGREQSTITHL